MPRKTLAAELIEIITPRRFVLSGLYLGPVQPKTLYIFIHGLSGNLFSRRELSTLLPDSKTGVLLFNNRGSGVVNGLKKDYGRTKKKKFSRMLGGSAFEVFTDCLDDLDGAVNSARSYGAKNIYLVGHSTGCQKSVYYLSRRPKSLVRGAVLLAPVSDYSTIKGELGEKAYQKALAWAKRLLRQGAGQTLLPAKVWEGFLSAQRFLSLYTPKSAEEIFSYASGRRPTTLRQVKKPLLILLAGEDEYHDRPTEEIAAWFKAALSDRRATVKTIKGVPHNFLPRQKYLAGLIKDWASEFNKKN